MHMTKADLEAAARLSIDTDPKLQRKKQKEGKQTHQAPSAATELLRLLDRICVFLFHRGPSNTKSQ